LRAQDIVPGLGERAPEPIDGEPEPHNQQRERLEVYRLMFNKR